MLIVLFIVFVQMGPNMFLTGINQRSPGTDGETGNISKTFHGHAPI